MGRGREGLVRDAKEHGVTILPVDLNESDWDSTLEARDECEHRTSNGRRSTSMFDVQCSMFTIPLSHERKPTYLP
jgi:DNA polymerase III alpha subunit